MAWVVAAVLTRQTMRNACWQSGPDSVGQTGCTAWGTGCAPEVGAWEEPVCWKRCGPAGAPPCCTSDTGPATQTPPTAGRCPPGHKCPAAAASLPASCPTGCWSSAGAAGRPVLPTSCHLRSGCSWRGHAEVQPPPTNLPYCHPSCCHYRRHHCLPGWRTRTKMACTRKILACDHCRCCCFRSAMRIPAEPTRNACPPGGTRTPRTRSVPASARATGWWTIGDTRSGPLPVIASSAIGPRDARI